MRRLRERREQSRNRAGDCSEIRHEGPEEREHREQEPSVHAGKREPQARQGPHDRHRHENAAEPAAKRS